MRTLVQIFLVLSGGFLTFLLLKILVTIKVGRLEERDPAAIAKHLKHLEFVGTIAIAAAAMFGGLLYWIPPTPSLDYSLILLAKEERML